MADLRADFRDIWAGRETSDTGKQADPDAVVAVDFNTTVDPTRVQAQFTPTVTDGTCGGVIGTSVGNSVISADTWGRLTSNSTRPTTPAPYNVFAFETVSGTPSIAGAVAAGGDVSLSSFSVNGTAGQPVGLIAGGRAVLANGSVRGDLTYGIASTVPQSVSVTGTKSLKPFDLTAARPSLESLSRLLAEVPASGTTQLNGSELVLNGTNAGRNTFVVSAAALAQASSVRISVPAGAGALINVTGASVVLENKSFVIQGVTASTLLWNLSEASLLKVASIGLSGSVLAPSARVSFESGSISGTVAARSVASPGSGSFAAAPLNATLLLGTSAPSSVELRAAQPLVRGCEYEFAISSTAPLTSGGNCLTTPVSVRFRVARGPSTPAARELASATSDPVTGGLRRFESRSGINTPVSEVFRRYQAAIGVLPSELVPTGVSFPSSTRAGDTFIAYRQLYLGYPVAGYGYLVSASGGIFRDANGKVATGLPTPPASPVSGDAALATALQFLHITTPPWVSNPALNHRPAQTLTWVAKRPKATGADFVLVWDFRFAGTGLVEPGGLQVDATTNRVLGTDPGSVQQAPLAPLAPLDPAATFAGRHTPNTVDTLFGTGAKTIDVPVYTQPTGAVVTTLATNPLDTPALIETVIQPEPSGGPSTTLIRVTDPTPLTPWTGTEPLEQIMATIQWGLVSSRDYLASLEFRVVPGATVWTSIDGLNQQKLVARWRNSGASSDNARYRASLSTPDTAIIDFINAPPAPPATPFIAPHEFAHLVLANIRRSSLLQPTLNRYESGALNEGMADLFALGETHKLLGERADWPCSQDGSTCLRDLSNPLRTNKPIFYEGTNFNFYANVTSTCTDDNDQCSVHNNSTVISHWGFLLGFGSGRAGVANQCGLTLDPLDPNPDAAMKRLLNLDFLAGGTRLGVTGSPDEPSFADFRDATLSAARSLELQNQVPRGTTRKLELAWYAVGVGPQFLSEPPIVLPTDRPIVDPPDEAVSVSPWLDFKWPINGDGQNATSWDFQIADGPFDTSTRLTKQNITDTVDVDGTTMGKLGVALPFNSAKQYFWRVRPHSNDAWQSCSPVHSFAATTTPGSVQNIEPTDVIVAGGMVQPGDAHFHWDDVEGAASYKVFVATHPTNCQTGPGVWSLETEINQAAVTALQPQELYYISVLPIGPPDFSGLQSPGTCTTATFNTATLRAPFLHEPSDTGLYNYHGTSHPTFVWSSLDGPVQYRLQFFEIDQFGNCTGNQPSITRTVSATCTNGCTESFADDILVPRNPSGYCWNVVSIAQNNRESVPSDTWHVFYGHTAPRKLGPGLQIHDIANGAPATIPGNSFGQPVTFSWVPDSDAFQFVVKVAPWPWNLDVPTDPPNCAFVANIGPGDKVHRFPREMGCNDGSANNAHYQWFQGGSSGSVAGDFAARGRYCYTMWVEVENPSSPGNPSARQPFVDVNPFFCYTSGPAEPKVEIDNPPTATSFSSLPITGRITIDYVPDMQLEITGSPAADFTFNYDDCKPDERTVLFDDRYDCVVEFEAKSHESTDYSIRMRTWNSNSHPPTMDTTTLVHDKVETFKTVACGARGEACCDTKCDTSSLVCQTGTGKCVDCGQANQPCCNNNACSTSSLVCQSNKCVGCGELNQACCGGTNKCPGEDTGNSCVNNLCQCPTHELACGDSPCEDAFNVPNVPEWNAWRAAHPQDLAFVCNNHVESCNPTLVEFPQGNGHFTCCPPGTRFFVPNQPMMQGCCPSGTVNAGFGLCCGAQFPNPTPAGICCPPGYTRSDGVNCFP